MFRKKKEKFNLYLDEMEYLDSEDDLLDEEVLDDALLEEALPEDALLEEDAELIMESGESAAAEAAPLADSKNENAKEPAKKSIFGRKKKNAGKKAGENKKKKEKQPKEKKERIPLFKKKKAEADIAPGSGLEDPKKKLTKKKIAAIAAAAVIVVGASVFFIIHSLGGDDDGKAYVESVGELTGLGSANGMSNRYTGEVEAQDSWKITLQTDMSVAKCYVSVGDEVKKGDKLFAYNTEELKLNKEKKELEVETLTNEMSQLTKDIAGYQNDLKTASASEKIELQTQILTAQTTIKKDEFTIKSSKEEIKTLEKNIKDATVKSKMAGLVKSINNSLGESSGGDEESSSYDESSGDSTYMTILALGDYRIKGTISETNVWMLNEGDPVIVRSRVDDNATWSGTISKIKTDTNADSESQSSSDIEYDMGESSKESASNYNFYVKLGQDEGLMLGQHVLIEVDNGQDDEKSGMWLNSAYLHIDGDNYYVWADNGHGRLTLRKIKVGDYNEELDEYEILDGLAITDYIASDSDTLHEKMRTTKVDSEADSTEYYNEEQNDDELYDEGMEDQGDDGSDSEFIEDSDEGLGADILDESGDLDEEDDNDTVTIN